MKTLINKIKQLLFPKKILITKRILNEIIKQEHHAIKNINLFIEFEIDDRYGDKYIQHSYYSYDDDMCYEEIDYEYDDELFKNDEIELIEEE